MFVEKINDTGYDNWQNTSTLLNKHVEARVYKRMEMLKTEVEMKTKRVLSQIHIECCISNFK